jgi:hypothetical protein
MSGKVAFLLLSVGFLLRGALVAQTHFNPTTTLTAETANNTSAADSFTGQANGNATPGNVSKVPIQSLLYPGSTAKVFAHLVQWFGYGDHVDVGYTSGDALQVHRQVIDMVSRGLDGAIVDWYGRGEARKTFRAYDEGTQLLMQEAEQHPGFTFAVMLDVGANKDCSRSRDCDPTENLIADLNYAYRTYEESSAYLRSDNRPVVFFFGQEGQGIEWKRVRSRIAGNPIFIFRNSGAFHHEEGDGGFSWVSPLEVGKDDPMALSYLVHYYHAALNHGDQFSLGTAYKGFDDSIALWGSHRLIDQQCGATWLQSIAEANQFYSPKTQMTGIQLVTWNDYEEGTEFETGISNCVKLSVSARGTKALWTVEGDASTIDHYTVFVSRDGENLMPIADLAPDVRSLDLAKFSLDPADYTVYVKAVGKPSLTNHVSEGRKLTISSSNNQAPFSAQQAPNVFMAGHTAPASVNITIRPNGSLVDGFGTGSMVIDFGDGAVVMGQAAVEHIYRLPGSYAVMVTTTDPGGFSATQSVLITVDAP